MATRQPERRYADESSVAITRRDDGTATITGYASVFYREGEPGTEYRLFDTVYERIAPGAFERAIDEDDVRALFNHDSNFVLGRNAAGTLRLTEDSVGLRYEIEPPDTEQARGVLASVERGDVSGSSFAFIPTRTKISEEEGRTVREIRAVELFDVGPVTYPAYPATTSGVRGVDAEAIRAEIRNHQATGADLVRDQRQATMFSNAVNIAADLARAGLRTDI